METGATEYQQAHDEINAEIGRSARPFTGGIHPDVKIPPTSSVHPTASVEEGVEIGADVTIKMGAKVCKGSKIGDGATLGEESYVGPGCEIGEGAHLGEGTTLRGRNKVGANTRIHSEPRYGMPSRSIRPVWSRSPPRAPAMCCSHPGSSVNVLASFAVIPATTATSSSSGSVAAPCASSRLRTASSVGALPRFRVTAPGVSAFLGLPRRLPPATV